MCVTHIFPLLTLREEIKDSFLFYWAVEMKPDVDLLLGFSVGLLTGHKTVEVYRQRSKHSNSPGHFQCLFLLYACCLMRNFFYLHRGIHCLF